jgi:hypothetical protein
LNLKKFFLEKSTKVGEYVPTSFGDLDPKKLLGACSRNIRSYSSYG